MPLRVVLVLHNLRVGGAERVMLRLAGGFAGRGAEVQVVTLVDAAGPLASEVPTGVQLVALGAPRVALSVARLARHLRSVRPDTVVATLPHVNVATALALRLARSRARLVLREANDPSFEHRLHGFGGWARGLVTRFAYARADAVVALTEGNASAIESVLHVPRSRVHVAPNPAPAVLESPNHAPEPQGAPAGAPRLLCVARLAPQKDHATLLEAFAKVSTARPSAVLALLGDGPERGAIEERTRTLGLGDRVHLAGTVMDIGPWWRWADVLVLASRWEGFPNVLLEALQQGVPIVATDCPTGPREVLGEPPLGALAPVGDATALAQAIDRVLVDPPAADQLRARAAAFGLERVVELWWPLLEGSG